MGTTNLGHFGVVLVTHHDARWTRKAGATLGKVKKIRTKNQQIWIATLLICQDRSRIHGFYRNLLYIYICSTCLPFWGLPQLYITTMWLGNWFSFLRSDRKMDVDNHSSDALPTGERSYPVLSRSYPMEITDCLLLKSNDIPWTSHENPMKILWTSHEHPMKIPWACHEHAIFSSLLYSETESILDDPYPRQETSAPRYGARCEQRRPPHSQPPWCRHPRRGSPVGSWLWRPPNGCQLRGGHLYYCKIP